jgi:transcriptional regulator with XRE-family HTH domain
MNTLSALARRVQKLRQKVGITQEQLSERAGISPKNLSDLENGRGNPTLSSLEGLAAALDLSLSELFDFQSEQFSPEEMRTQICDSISKATEEECRLCYRLLRILMK